MDFKILNIYNKPNISFGNNCKYSTNPKIDFERSPNSDIFIKSTSPQFTSSHRSSNSTKQGRFLKKLNDITDPYCGCKILTKDQFEKYQNRIPQIEDTNIRINHISMYQRYMRPVEKQIYLKLANKIRKYEKEKNETAPYLSFSQILKEEEPAALQRLIEKERNIFNLVLEETKLMKPENAKKVIDLVNKVAPTIEDNNHRFQRKEFIQSLLNMREEQKNNPHFEYLVSIALKLPCSHIDEDAFIVKYSDRSEEEITNRLLSSSVGTIEHIVPESEGGKNEASNFLLTTAGSNIERDIMSHKDFIKLHPKIPKYTQEYINDIINAGNNGKLVDHEWYPYLVAETIKEKMNIEVNLSKYKIKPKKAFRTFPDRLREKHNEFSQYYTKPVISTNKNKKTINKNLSMKVVNTQVENSIVNNKKEEIKLVTQGRSTANGNFLKHLENIRDPYSGVIMLTNREMADISEKLSENNTIRKKIKFLNNYENSMLPVEKAAFNMFKQEAKKDKNTTFGEILKQQKNSCMNGLIKEQNAVFKEIEKEAQIISPEHKEKIMKELEEARIRISLPNDDKHRFKRKVFIDRIIDIYQNDILDKIENKIINLPNYQKYEALEAFFNAKEATNYKFYDTNINGKSPIDLVKDLQIKYAPETINETNDLDNIIDIAKKLPTSKNSLNAFVIKYWDRSDKEITERLLNQSIITIEHIKPYSKGGSNEAYNFMMATKSRNEERGNMPFDELIKLHPEIPKCLQEYTDDIIEAGNKGHLKDHEWYPYVVQSTIEEESGVKVDISKYKITPEKAFKSFPPRLKFKYPQFAKYIAEPNEAINLNYNK